MSINIDLKRKTVDDAHRQRNKSAQKMRTAEDQDQPKSRSKSKQAKPIMQQSHEELVMPVFQLNNTGTQGSEMRKGFIGKDLGRVQGEFDNYERQFTNEPSDLFRDSDFKPRKVSYERSLDDNQTALMMSVKKTKNLGQLRKPNTVKIVKNQDVTLRNMRSQDARSRANDISGQPYQGNADLDAIRSGRKKSFSPSYHRTPLKDSTKRGTSPATRQKQSGQAKYTTQNFRGSSAKQPKNTLSKNAQIQSKFDKQDQEFPINGGSRTSKALVQKMRELGGQRKRVVQQASSIGRARSKSKKAAALSPPQKMAKKNLQQEYEGRRERMDSRLGQELDKNVIVPQGVIIPRKQIKDIYAESNQESEAEAYELDLIPGREGSPQTRPLRLNEKRVDYVRSKRAVQDRIEARFTTDVNELDYDKTRLIQELNARLVELDDLNEEKRALSVQLINQIKFVRDLQVSLGTADNGHITDIIDKEMEQSFREAKEEGIRLRELLKANQIEMDEIVYQIKLLQGEKDVTIVMRNGREVNLQKTTMGIDELMRYRQTILRDIDRMTQDINRARTEDDDLTRHVSQLQREFDDLNQDRSKIADEVRALQSQYDSTYHQNEARIREMAYQFRRSKSRHSAQCLGNALVSIFNRRLLAAFQEVRFQIKSDENQIASVLAFRKICYSYNDSRLRKYIQLWFQKALKPAQMIYQNKQVTKYQTKNNFLKNILIKWHHQQLISQTQGSSGKQSIKSCQHRLKNYYLRELRRSFDLWKTHTNSRNCGQRKIINFIRERTSIQKRMALFRWKKIVLEQNFQMKCQAKAIRNTVLQYKSGIFYAWRQQATILRRKRISLMIRTWKILNWNRQFQKQVKNTTMCILKRETEYSENHLLNVFNALKLNKELEKQEKCNDRIKDEEDVLIEQSKQKIKKVQARSAHKAAKKAVKEGIVSPFTKVLKSYFDKWRQVNDNYKFTLNNKIKVQIVKVYKQMLSEAFEKMKAKGTKKKRRMKMKMQMEMESTNETIQSEVAATMEKVQAAEVRSIQKGQSKFKRMLLKAYHAELRYRLNQWKGQLVKLNSKGDKLKKFVIDRWQKRLYRQGFEMFKNKNISIKREIKQNDRTDKLIERFQNRLLRRMYDTLQASANIKIRAKKQFKKILTTEYNSYLRFHFNTWKGFQERKKVKRMRKKQAMVTEEMQETINDKGETENVIFEQERKMAELVRSNRSMSRKTMKKFLAQWRNHTLHLFFCKWKQKSAFQNETKQKLQGSIFKKLYHSISRDAFQTWRRNMVILHQRDTKFSGVIEQENYEKQEDRIEKSRTKIAQEREQAAHKIEKLKNKQIYKQKLIKNSIEKLTKDRQNNYVINKKEHIFEVWRQIASHRAKTLRAFERLVTQNHLQHGFDMICMTRNLDDRQAIRDKTLNKFIRAWQDNNCKEAWNKWKQFSFQTVTARIETLKTFEYHTKGNSEIKRNQFIEQSVPRYLKKTQMRTAQKVFEILFDYRTKRLQKKMDQNELEDKFGFLRMRFQFQKWVLRSDHAIIYRQKHKILTRRINRQIKENVFNALKSNRKQNKDLYKMCRTIQLNLNEEHLRFAWKQIRQQSHLVKIQRERKYEDNKRLISSLTNKLRHKNLKHRFDQFLMNSRNMYYKKVKVKQMLHNQIDRFNRDFFNKWKRNASLLEVVRYNNEEGPITMEIFELKKKEKAYREFIKDKMINDGSGKVITFDEIDKDLDEKLNKNEDDYLNKINKAKIRWQFFGEGNRRENDKWLLPYCFDQWRLWKEKRKSYKAALRTISVHTDEQGGELGRAFYKWKKKSAERIKYLMGLTQEELFQRANANHLALLEVSQDLEAAHDEIEDLKNQREYLIEKVVLGQRLALARCRFSFMYAKEKVWVKLAANCLGGMRAQFDAALTAQVGEIGDLKGRMVELEQENTDIAEQNEGLREGALEGVDALPQLESVQSEVEGLNTQLMEQAEQIKELLAKNKELKSQLYELGQ